MTTGSKIAAVALAMLVALLAAVPWLVSDYGLGFMVNLMCYLVLTIAWTLFSGTTRYVSLATAAFFGLGAYTVAMLVKEMPIYATFGIALVIGTVMALLVGLVTLRVSGMFFVVFGFGLSELMREVLIWWEINQTKTLGRYVFVPFDTTLIYWHLLGLAVLVFLVGWLLRRTRLGIALLVIGDDETMARQAGINVPLAKSRSSSCPPCHDGGWRGDGAALRLSHAQFRVQPADLVPGRDHGVARRHAPAVGSGARRGAADAAVGAAAGAVSVLVQRLSRPRVHDHRVFPSPRDHRPGGGRLAGAAPTHFAAARCHRAADRRLGLVVATDIVAARHRGVRRRHLGPAHSPPTDRRALMAALLEVDGLTKAFGGLVAVNYMSLSVSPGEVLGLIGPNGSGKTTLLNLIAGTIRSDAGTIRIGGEDVTRLPNHLRVRKRINRTFQLVRMPPNLPAIVGVMAGVMYGAEPKRYKDAEYEAAGILGELNLLLKAGYRLDQLTYIEQKRVELARALATRPRVLLLDEWLSGLSPGELDGGMSVVWSLAAQGIAVILVEHVMTAVRALCSRVVVMNAGVKIAEGPPREVLRDAEVIRAYLGDDDA